VIEKAVAYVVPVERIVSQVTCKAEVSRCQRRPEGEGWVVYTPSMPSEV